jgi:hypothetical protein
MSSSEDEASTPSASDFMYKKLLPDGTVDSKSLQKTDHDLVHHFIKTAFPKATRAQKEIEQTLKRVSWLLSI